MDQRSLGGWAMRLRAWVGEVGEGVDRNSNLGKPVVAMDTIPRASEKVRFGAKPGF